MRRDENEMFKVFSSKQVASDQTYSTKFKLNKCPEGVNMTRINDKISICEGERFQRKAENSTLKLNSLVLVIFVSFILSV